MVERVPAASGKSLSDAVEVGGSGRWIFVSGQVARAPDRERLNLAEQARICFGQMASILSERGARLEHVVRITAYVTTFDGYDAYDRVRREEFGSALPASAAVGVVDLLGDGTKIEIDAVAFVEAGDESARTPRSAGQS